MKNPTLNVNQETFFSSGKNNGKLWLYPEYFEFQIEKDHTLRKITFSELNDLKIKKIKWIHIFYFVFLNSFFNHFYLPVLF